MTTAKQENFLSQFRDKGTKTLRNFTAAQFAEVWSHYDTDGNGYIEGGELDNFLREFMSSIFQSESEQASLTESALSNMKKDFMAAFDENADNKIEIYELAKILPTDETFLLLFRRDNPVKSSMEFMKVWKQFDKDRSGFIESDELKSFLTHLLTEAKVLDNIHEDKIDEYTKTMLQLFDSNKDGKLQLSEMAKLLPVKENYLAKPIFNNAGNITAADVDTIFNLYDKDGNGTIEDEELSGFLKDFLELLKQEYNEKDMEFYKSIILDQWDVNHDGKINREELKMILLQQSKICEAEKYNK